MTPQKGYVWFLPAWLAPDWWNPNHSHLDGDTSEGILSIPCSAANMEEFVSGGYFSLSNAFYGEDLDTILSGGTVNQWRQEYERRVKNQVISAVYIFSCIQSPTLTLSLSRSLNLMPCNCALHCMQYFVTACNCLYENINLSLLVSTAVS